MGWLIATIIRTFAATCRWRLHDPDNLSENLPDSPLIWAFWHNRIFVIPVVYHKYLKSREGAVLSSASRDGEIIAATVRCFGCHSVRGSSSRKGVSAMLKLTDWLDQGYDVAVVPDGPRGPRYRLHPGVVKLAQITGAGILSIRVEYSSSWRLKSWDQFRIPKPFSAVTVFFDPIVKLHATEDEAEFEAERHRLEQIMNPNGETE